MRNGMWAAVVIIVMVMVMVMVDGDDGGVTVCSQSIESLPPTPSRSTPPRRRRSAEASHAIAAVRSDERRPDL